MTVLSVRDLGKSYRSYSSEWKRIANWFGISGKGATEHWVLRHINFDVQPGEAIGIVGQNGAGKSTLLKMITGVLQPSEGSVHVHGRIAAILELGMGFNPDLTGRQNVIHAACLMGYNQSQIEEALPSIEAFAEIGDYFDAALRTYSSGMQMRVAFSVATAFRPDILIVDEALTVGDAYFQVKCIYKIKEYLKAGTTLFLVSHDTGSIKTLCQRALLIDGGRILSDDDALSVIKLHQSLMIKKENDNNYIAAPTETETNQTDKPVSEDRLALKKDILISEDAIDAVNLRFLDQNNVPISHIVSGGMLKVEISVKFKKSFNDPHVGFGIRDKNGLTIYETNTYCLHKNTGTVDSGQTLTVTFYFNCDLGQGNFSFVIGVANEGINGCTFKDHLYFDHDFKVLKVLKADGDVWAGYFNLAPQVIIDR
jgi:lipopolysaccharide transport system ATP-binding protein